MFSNSFTAIVFEQAAPKWHTHRSIMHMILMNTQKNDLLHGKRVALLATDGFEQSELMDPLHALEDAGATVEVLSLKKANIRGWKEDDFGDTVQIDRLVSEANPGDYEALVLPGGVMNPDKLRQDKNAVNFVRIFMSSGRLVAAICHGPQLLIEADTVRGRKLTSYNSIRTDVINAGGTWENKPVVIDENLITSRQPSDLPQFNQAIIDHLSHSFDRTPKPQALDLVDVDPQTV